MVLKFDDQLVKMTGHICRAARIWETYQVSLSNLAKPSVMIR